MPGERGRDLLAFSFAVLSVAVGVGALLLAGQARRAAPVHGWIGAAGAAAVCLAAYGGRPQGQSAYAVVGLLLAALCGGLFIWRGWRAGLVVFLHAMAGGVGYLLMVGAVFG